MHWRDIHLSPDCRGERLLDYAWTRCANTRPDRCAADAVHRRPQGRRGRPRPPDRLRRQGLPRHHGGRRRRRDPGIHLSEPRRAQGPDPPHHRAHRQARAGHGRHLARFVQDRDRARPRRRALGRRGGATSRAAPSFRRPADASRPDRLFRGDRPRDQAADHALSQSRPRRRRVHPRHHCARQASAGAAHQGKLARPRPGVAADRRDRPRRPRPLLHHHADAARHFAAWRLGRDHAAAGLRDRARGDRRVRGQGLRARRRNPAPVRAVPREVDAPRAGAGHEGRDEPDRHPGRRALSALFAAQPRRNGGDGSAH